MRLIRRCASVMLAVAIGGCTAKSPIATQSFAFAPTCAGCTAPAGARIVLNATAAGPKVDPDVYGASIVTWYDFRAPFVAPSLRRLGIRLIRFPGGSQSDIYHWENGGTLCGKNLGYIAPGATFANLARDLSLPLHLDVAVTLNYGSNRACNGGGSASEAGAWVAYAKAHGYPVRYWTVGNESYGSWEYDLHAHPHDPETYAAAVKSGYYPAVKAANPNARVGIVVDSPNDRAWNDVVLRQSGPFDFVELHYYPQYQIDSDARLLGPAIGGFARELKQLRAEMTADGVSSRIPIYLGEFNNDAGQEGKQSVSIVNGLYLGQMLGTLIAAGVPMATWWLAYGSCDQGGDYSGALYGWQRFGSEALFSDGLPNANEGCATTPRMAGGTPFPTARVMTLYAQTVPGGSRVRAVTLSKGLWPSVRAYGYAIASGYALMLFNNTPTDRAVVAAVRGGGAAFVATLSTYGKVQYDRSRQNRWVGPVTRSLGRVGTSIPLALAPYSLTALRLKATP